MTSSLPWVNAHESAPGSEWSVHCSGQCPHSPTLDLNGMSRLLSQTVSLIYFKEWKTQHLLFCTGSLVAHCLLMVFIKTTSAQQKAYEPIHNHLLKQCWQWCNKHLLSSTVLLLSVSLTVRLGGGFIPLQDNLPLHVANKIWTWTHSLQLLLPAGYFNVCLHHLWSCLIPFSVFRCSFSWQRSIIYGSRKCDTDFQDTVFWENWTPMLVRLRGWSANPNKCVEGRITGTGHLLLDKFRHSVRKAVPKNYRRWDATSAENALRKCNSGEGS